MPNSQASAPAASAVHSSSHSHQFEQGATVPPRFAAFHQPDDSDVLRSPIGYGSPPVIFVDAGGDLKVLAGVLAARSAGLDRLVALFAAASPDSDLSWADLAATMAPAVGEVAQLSMIVSERIRTGCAGQPVAGACRDQVVRHGQPDALELASVSEGERVDVDEPEASGAVCGPNWFPVVLFAEGRRRLDAVAGQDRALDVARQACLADGAAVGFTIELEI